jgi:hypothetical protein
LAGVLFYVGDASVSCVVHASCLAVVLILLLLYIPVA